MSLRLVSRLCFAQFQQTVGRSKQPRFIARVQVAQARAVDGDHAQAAGLLGAAKQAVAALEKVRANPAAGGSTWSAPCSAPARS